MKIESSRVKTFHPVVITITLENQDELDRFGALMNYAPINEFLGDETEYHEVLERAGADLHKHIETITQKCEGKKK